MKLAETIADNDAECTEGREDPPNEADRNVQEWAAFYTRRIETAYSIYKLPQFQQLLRKARNHLGIPADGFPDADSVNAYADETNAEEEAAIVQSRADWEAAKAAAIAAGIPWHAEWRGPDPKQMPCRKTDQRYWAWAIAREMHLDDTYHFWLRLCFFGAIDNLFEPDVVGTFELLGFDDRSPTPPLSLVLTEEMPDGFVRQLTRGARRILAARRQAVNDGRDKYLATQFDDDLADLKKNLALTPENLRWQSPVLSHEERLENALLCRYVPYTFGYTSVAQTGEGREYLEYKGLGNAPWAQRRQAIRNAIKAAKKRQAAQALTV